MSSFDELPAVSLRIPEKIWTYENTEMSEHKGRNMENYSLIRQEH